MSDLFKTQMQETGRASTLGMSLAEVVNDVVELGIDPRHVLLNGSRAVMIGDPERSSLEEVVEARKEQFEGIFRWLFGEAIRRSKAKEA